MVNSTYCDGRAAYLQNVFHKNLARVFSLIIFFYHQTKFYYNRAWGADLTNSEVKNEN